MVRNRSSHTIVAVKILCCSSGRYLGLAVASTYRQGPSPIAASWGSSSKVAMNDPMKETVAAAAPRAEPLLLTMSCGHNIISSSDLPLSDNTIREEKCSSQCKICDATGLDDNIEECQEALGHLNLRWLNIKTMISVMVDVEGGYWLEYLERKLCQLIRETEENIEEDEQKWGDKWCAPESSDEEMDVVQEPIREENVSERNENAAR